MKAAVLRSPGPPTALAVEDVPVPNLHDRGILVEVAACGVCYHDIAVRNGTLRGVRFPVVLGHEVAGIILETGAGVTRFKAGDRVCCKQMASCGDCKYCRSGDETLCDDFVANEGGYAELVVLPEESLVRVPDALSLDAASLLACAVGVGYHALKRTSVGLGDVVLVTGAGGGIGLHTVQLAKLAGARVIAQTSSQHKADAIRAMGADDVIVSPTLEFADAVLDLTAGLGVNVVLENVGAKAFDAAWRSLAKAGRFAFVGATGRESISINPALVFRKGARFYGSISTSRAELEEIVALASAGRITPCVGSVITLDEIHRAHALMETRSTVGRVVVRPRSSLVSQDGGTE